MIVAIKIIGIFLGVLARSLAPYLRKLREGKIKSFHRRHLVSSIGSLVLGIIITLLIAVLLFLLVLRRKICQHLYFGKGQRGILLLLFLD